MFTACLFYLDSRVPSLAVSPELPFSSEPQDIEPQDEGSILMALHEEATQEEHEQPPLHPEPHPEPQPETQPQPQLRRSARIKARNKPQDAIPPKVKTPAKSTSRKRAVRKK